MTKLKIRHLKTRGTASTKAHFVYRRRCYKMRSRRLVETKATTTKEPTLGPHAFTSAKREIRKEIAIILGYWRGPWVTSSNNNYLLETIIFNDWSNVGTYSRDSRYQTNTNITDRPVSIRVLQLKGKWERAAGVRETRKRMGKTREKKQS